MEKLLHIELFAGCGGMTLGLEAAGFELFFANELSPMAAETFAYNLLNENLETLAGEGKEPRKSLWIKSAYQFRYVSLKCSGKREDLNWFVFILHSAGVGLFNDSCVPRLTRWRIP